MATETAISPTKTALAALKRRSIARTSRPGA
jgi:hypothetical protein